MVERALENIRAGAGKVSCMWPSGRELGGRVVLGEGSQGTWGKLTKSAATQVKENWVAGLPFVGLVGEGVNLAGDVHK